MNKFTPLLHLQLPEKAKPRSKANSLAFIGLNVLRALSMISILLAIASSIVVMVSDLKAVNAWIKAGSPSSGLSNATSTTDSNNYDCDVIEYSTVPNQTGGPFFSVLSRLILILILIVLFLSELGGPKFIRKLFESYLSPLGPAHGLATLGFTQCFIATIILSHYIPIFSQASAWIIFITGCANFCIGLFGSKVKTQRQIFSFENLSTLTPQTSLAYSAYETGKSFYSSAPSPPLGGIKDKFFARFSRNPSGENQAGYVDVEKGAEQAGVRIKVGKIPGVSFGGQAARKEAARGTDGPGWGGFGKKGENAAKLKGYLISKPINVVPKS